MKKIVISSILILLTALSAMAQNAQPARADSNGPIKAAFETLVDGIRSADAAKVMGVYDNSPDTLFFNNNGTITLGWEQMKSNRESSYAKVSNVTLETSNVRIRMLGVSGAYLTCRWKQSQESEGKIESASGRMTLIFRKIKNEWKVVHAHTSPDSPDLSRPVLPSERQ